MMLEWLVFEQWEIASQLRTSNVKYLQQKKVVEKCLSKCVKE